jgi:hypothetical protein
MGRPTCKPGSFWKFCPESGTQHTLKKQGKTALGQVPHVLPAIILDISGRDATAAVIFGAGIKRS